MKTTMILLVTLVSFFAQAQFSQGSQRARQVANAFKTSGCMDKANGLCQNGHKVQTYTGTQLQQLPLAMQQALHEIAHHQSQIWGDTILEGDFFAEGKVQVQKVKVLSQQNRTVGFQITYFEKAWYTGDCTYHHSRPETLKACRPGHIFETSFVTSDATEAQVDENQFAKFQPQD